MMAVTFRVEKLRPKPNTTRRRPYCFRIPSNRGVIIWGNSASYDLATGTFTHQQSMAHGRWSPTPNDRAAAENDSGGDGGVFRAKNVASQFRRTSYQRVRSEIAGEVAVWNAVRPLSGRSHRSRDTARSSRYGVYLKLVMCMYQVTPGEAVPPHDELFVPHRLNRNGAGALGTAWL
jgi:hypothetical protein